ncbi:hypothetical protein [Cohnella terricola]|uniref:Bactofilin n=1 Tax=Cohnella terricola TaxID=1289167 RepID=A0A559JFJ7_9BACL|nr:hypothetical protein [Cohnella terricola]TVX98637.1 hypothetical protein FPZ45_15125 [Cohnella terricola]
MNHSNSDVIRINGIGTYIEDVYSKAIRVVGHGQFKGMIQTCSFKNNGSCSVKSDCIAKDFSNIGHGHFHSITAEHIYSAGSIHVDTSVSVETFHANGLIHIEDTLSAKEVRIKFHYKSFFRHIIAKKNIEICSDRLSFANLIRLGRRNGKCTSLKGRHIVIEHLDADLVIGEDIIIGPGCKIREVQYSKSLSVNPRSLVQHTVQIK